jgi:sugar lactone lactonase YvrE
MKPVGAIAGALMSAVVPVFAAAGSVLLFSACASCQSTVTTTAMPVFASGSSFDAAEIDQATHRMFVADRTAKGVDVVDLSASTPRFATTVDLGGGPNGLAFAPDQRRLYAALEDGTVAVIDTDSLRAIDTITVDTTGVDLIDYSAKTDSLYVGDGSAVAVVDLSTKQVTKRITTAASAVEQPRYDPANGMVYVTTPRASQLVELNPTTGYVSRTFTIVKCNPRGLGINVARQLALVACGGSIAFVNLRNGAQAVTRAVQGGDIVTYDATADRFVVASPHNNTDSTLGVFAGDGRFIGSVTSTPVAHAAVYDDSRGLVYAPSKTGLMSFAPEACAPPPDWVKFVGGLSAFAVPMIALAVFLVVYTRRRRRAPTEPPRVTDRELRDQDLALERERMRALEDAIFGPEP